MKRFFFAICVLLSYACNAQTFISSPNNSVLTEYNDGKLWAYQNRDNIVVGLTCFEAIDNYGKYYQLGIFVKNVGDNSVTVYPDSIYSNLITRRNDTLHIEVYTIEEYQKKVRRLQMWTMALVGFSAGFSAGNAGYTTSYSTSYSPTGLPYTTITRHYDANAAYQANVASTNQIITLGQMMENDYAVREQGYLKTTTVHPGEAIVGYMNIKRKKGEILTVNIPVNGCVYGFDWNVSKKK